MRGIRTILLILRCVFALQEFHSEPPLVQFNSTNFYLNASCKLNSAIGTITAADSATRDLSYQIFGSQDFAVHKHRGDVIMVKKPKDPYPLFYISAVDAATGSSATAVVEVSHNCPTVSFDAVSYHFFALRRAPSSTVGLLNASGGDDIRYSTESEVFHVDDMTGIISAKVILPIDTTSIFYVKAADRKGNTDVAEVVVEVIGCYMDVDVPQERRFDVVFDKRCYDFVLTSCESGVIVGAVRAKGSPEPSYEYRDHQFYLNPEDGVIMTKKHIEPGTVHLLNVLAINGQAAANRDVTLVTVDTRVCGPLPTSPTTQATHPVVVNEPQDETGNSIPVSPALSGKVQPLAPGEFDIFDTNGTLAEDDPLAFNQTDEDVFPLLNRTEWLFFNGTDVFTPGNASSGDNATISPLPSPGRNNSFVLHVTSNSSKTVRPIYGQKFNGGLPIYVKISRHESSLSSDNQGIEIV